MANLLTLLVAFHSLTALAELDKATQEALQKTMEMLVTPGLRTEEINRTKEGCGSNRGQIDTPLTEDQKAEFKQTLESAGRVERAGKQAQNDRNRADNQAHTDDEVLEKMARRLLEAQCAIEVTQPQQSASSGDFQDFMKDMEFGMKMSGATCPVSMDMRFKMKSDLDMTAKTMSAKLEMRMAYEVKDAEFAELNDVTGMNVSGGGTITAREGSVDGEVTVEGKLSSRKHGDLETYLIAKIEGSGDENSANIRQEMVVGIQYPDYTAELKLVVTQTDKGISKEYFLNGQTITEKEYQEMVEKAGSLANMRG